MTLNDIKVDSCTNAKAYMYKTQFSVSWQGDGDPRFPLYMEFLNACGKLFGVEAWWAGPGESIQDLPSLHQYSRLDPQKSIANWTCHGGEPPIYVRVTAPKSEFLECSFNIDLTDHDVSWQIDDIAALIELTTPREASVWHQDNAAALRSKLSSAFGFGNVASICPVHFFDAGFLDRYGITMEHFLGYDCRELRVGTLFYLTRFFTESALTEIDVQFDASVAVHQCTKSNSLGKFS